MHTFEYVLSTYIMHITMVELRVSYNTHKHFFLLLSRGEWVTKKCIKM